MKTVAKVTRQTLLLVYLLIFMPLHRRWSSKVVTHLCVLDRTPADVVFPSRNNLTDSPRTVEIECQLICTDPIIRITGFSTTFPPAVEGCSVVILTRRVLCFHSQHPHLGYLQLPHKLQFPLFQILVIIF
jgi:hypothetical protein